MKKLLIIGAGFLQSFVVKKSRSIGYQTLAVDGNPNAVGFNYADKHAVIDITDKRACLEYAKNEKVDGVLTAATDYGVLTTSYIAQRMGLPGLNYKVAQIIKNKYQTRKCLFENNADDTEQVYEVNKDTDVEQLAEKLNYPVMVKPCDGSGSRGTSRVNSKKELKKACRFAINSSITNCALIETFIVGKEYGAEAFVINGEPFVLAILQKWITNPPYYAELGHAIPNDLKPEVETHAKECVRNAIKVLGIDFDAVNMDMIITPGGKVHIIDIGVRMGGNLIGSHIIPAGTGIDYMSAVICNAIGDKRELTIKENAAVVTRLLAFGGGTIKHLPDFEEIQKNNNVEIYHHLKMGDVVNEYHTNLDGCGYIVAIDKDRDVALKNAEHALIQVEKMIF